MKDDNGKFKVPPPGFVPESVEPSIAGTVLAPVSAAPVRAFAAEAHLRDYLANNLHVIEEGLQPYVDDEGNGHVEYRTDVGIIDIICLDKNEDLVVVELKVDGTSDAVAGQILRYVNWVRRHVANGKKVRGIIIAKDISDRLLYSIDNDPSIEAREYVMHVTLMAPAKELG